MKIEGFANMLKLIETERGIPKEMLVGAIEAALLSASRKKLGYGENLGVRIDNDGNVKVFIRKTVVETVENEETQITLKEAKKFDKAAVEGGEIEIESTPDDFGRLAAQTAKQVIIQRMREAEKGISFDEFSKKQGDLITGIIQQREYNGYLVNLGKLETVLPFQETAPGEVFHPKDRVKLYVVDVHKSSKGPFIAVSRTHPGMVKKLFELEIPEINEGVLEIKNVVREAGRRSKVAIISNDTNVSVVGTCVGPMGARIQNIVKELGSERVDIIEWKEDPKQYITNALSPAKPSKIELNNEEMTAIVTVPDSQLSLAIGKEGQNVRLASKLTGWKIDIRSDTEKKIVEEKKSEAEKEGAVNEGTEKESGEESTGGKKESAGSEEDKG